MTALLKQIFSFMLFVFALSSYTSLQAQHHKSLIKADRFYESGEYHLAEENYRKARESERELKSTFNLGNAVYKQERFEEAVDHYTSAAQLAPDNTKRSDAYYNCLLYTSPSPRDQRGSRMPSSA